MGEGLSITEIKEAMNSRRQHYAKNGWVLSEPHPPSGFDSSAPMTPEGYGYLEMADGNYYLIQCPLDGLTPDHHTDKMDAAVDSNGVTHSKARMTEAMKRLGQ